MSPQTCLTTNMPKGRDRKGGVPPRKRKQNHDDETCTRVPMTVTQSNTQSISVGATFQDKSSPSYRSPSYHFTSISVLSKWTEHSSGSSTPYCPSGSSTPSYPYCPIGSSTPSGPSTPSYPYFILSGWIEHSQVD